jgi:peptide/nickel transport system permease protein
VIRLVVHRLAIGIPLVLVASAVTFVLTALVPGDAARAILGVNAPPEAYERLRHQLGLDLPLWEQYARYIGGVFRGDLGTSLGSGEPVWSVLTQRLPVTLSLVVLTTLFCAVVGLVLGTVSAIRGGPLGRMVDVLSLAGLALPSFWVGLVLVTVFAVTLRTFPATGYAPFADSPSRWLWALTLPVVALGLAGVSTVAKQTRDAMLDVLDRDYIRTLRANGVRQRSIVWKHALRNASIPVTTVLGLVFVGLLSGTVFAESVFVLPGLGLQAVSATQQHDVAVIEGIALAFTVIVVLANLAIDLLYGWLNPKVRVR